MNREEVKAVLALLQTFPRDFVFSEILLLVKDRNSALQVVDALPEEVQEGLTEWAFSFTLAPRAPLDPFGLFASPDELVRRLQDLRHALTAEQPVTSLLGRIRRASAGPAIVEDYCAPAELALA